jgi:hypothetical protein
MLALQRQVEATWVATLDNDSTLCLDHGPELDIEPVAVELAFALVVFASSILRSSLASMPRTMKHIGVAATRDESSMA